MKIEISVQEYFNEMKQAKDKLDREECLYPWIYMLLKMAEIKKQDILKEWYKSVSIIDVHLIKRVANRPMASQLSKICGAPDIAIVDDDVIVGCVEIKAFSRGVIRKDCELPCRIDFPIGRKITKNEKKNDVWEYNENQLKNIVREKPNQILSHLEKFNKVIYTDGLEFYYLILKECANQNKYYIEVKELANLRNSFESYEKDNLNSLNLILEATAEWNRLIAGLTSIDWYKKPLKLEFDSVNFPEDDISTKEEE